AGGVLCVDVVDVGFAEVDKAVAANLAKLSPEDRALAEAQRTCAVQEGVRLGAMGVPVNLELKGKPVFLCCPACESAARKHPDRAVENAQPKRSDPTTGLRRSESALRAATPRSPQQGGLVRVLGADGKATTVPPGR